MTLPDLNSEVRPKRKRSHLQLSLRTFLLLVAIVAVWVTHVSNIRENSILRKRIDASRPMLRELIVKDERKITIVKQEELWYDENRWDVYLPPGAYQLCIATRQVDEKGVPPGQRQFRLVPGTHEIAIDQQLDKDTWRIVVSVDGQKAIEVEEPKDWNGSTGSTGGAEFSSITEFDLKEKVVLFRRRFNKPSGQNQFQVPAGPTEGIVLWMEAVEKR